LQTPVNYDQSQTFEDPGVVDPETRLSLFSQEDHVRVFGRDLFERLGAAGFDVQVIEPSDLGEPDRYVIDVARGPLRNDLFVCRPKE
jgi:hypothetical protein